MAVLHTQEPFFESGEAVFEFVDLLLRFGGLSREGLLAFRVLRFEFSGFLRDLFVALALSLLGLLEAFEAGLQLAGLRGERRMIFAGCVFMSECLIPSGLAAGDLLLEGGQRALTAQTVSWRAARSLPCLE